MPAIRGKHIRQYTPGRNGVDCDLLGPSIRGKRPRESFNRRLGSRIQRMILDARHRRRDGGSQDYPAAMREMPQPVLPDKVLRATVEVKDLIEFFLGDGFLVDERLHPRVRDNDIEAAKVRERLLEEAGHFRGVGDIGLDGDGAGVVLVLERGDQLVGGGGGFAVVDGDGGAASRQLKSNACSQAAAAACDEGHFTLKGPGTGL